MVDLLELAAANLLLPRLRDGETTVAIETDLRHLAHSISGELRVAAKERGATGRLRHFKVDVFDEKGLIASATHTRAVIAQRRLTGLARRRAGLPSMQLGV